MNIFSQWLLNRNTKMYIQSNGGSVVTVHSVNLVSIVASTRLVIGKGTQSKLLPCTRKILLYMWALPSLRNERVFDVKGPQ